MRPTIATFVAISVIVSAVVAVLTAGRSMRSRLLLAFICSTTLLSITLFAQQELGNQGTDPFTGRPAVPSVPSNAGNGNAPGFPSAEEEHRLVFKSRTMLVEVPTVVTDASGTHIHNLTKDDFKILENGKQQKIAVLEEIITSSDHLAQLPDHSGTFSNFIVDARPRFSATVIALDEINTPFLDQEYGRRQLLKYLAENLDTRRALGLVVVGTRGPRVLCGVNSDPAAVIGALKKVSGEMSPMESFGQEGKVLAATTSPTELTGGIAAGADPAAKMRQFIVNADAVEGGYHQTRAIEDTMKSLLAIAWSLSGIPGRKSLIWATGGFPFPLDNPSSVPGGNLSTLYERTMKALSDAQISVYPVDVRGLMSTVPVGDATYAGSIGELDFTASTAGRSWLLNSSARSLENLAEMTGGRAYANNNDLANGFRRAADDASSYYLLAYYEDGRNNNPGWRKLQVQVTRKGVEVHARSGFLITNATTDPELTHKADLGFALSSPFDSTGIQLTLKWQSVMPGGEKKKIAFALHFPASSVIDEGDKNRYDLDFVAQATKNGSPADHKGQTMKGAIPTDSLAKIKADGIFYKSDLELTPGDYQVRFVIRDNLSGRIGSVSVPLTVN